MSYLVCRLSQNCLLVPKYCASWLAMLVVMGCLFCMMLLICCGVVEMAVASWFGVMLSGARNSSYSISPGWIGMSVMVFVGVC